LARYRVTSSHLINMTLLVTPKHLTAVAILILAGVATNAKAEAPASRLPNGANLLTQVRAKLEVGGDILVPGQTEPAKVPMSVVANYDYIERRIDDGTQRDQRRSLRHYRGAKAAIKVGKQSSESSLEKDHQLVRAALTGHTTSLSAARGNFTRDELDLLEVPGNTLLLDLLLDGAELKQGAKWQPDDVALTRLLCIDAIRSSEVENRITSLNGEVGEVQFEGKITGEVADAETEIELKGKLHFDVRLHRPFALVMLIKEHRQLASAGPGLDVTARLQLQIEPIDECPQLADSALGDIELAGDGTAAPLEHRPASKEFRLLYDPRWRITRDDPDAVAMRLVDRGDLVAQCNVSVLSKVKLTEPITLESFQKDVQQSLGKNFGAFESAAERKHAAGYRLLHAAAHGRVSDVPIVWHYYLLIDEQGRRAALSFTMEAKLLERFGDADRLIIDEFRFSPASQATTQQAVKR
jgi:hypothetical protein